MSRDKSVGYIIYGPQDCRNVPAPWPAAKAWAYSKAVL